MITEKTKQLAALKATALELQAEIAAELQTTLAALPTAYGFESARVFIAAVRRATRGSKSRGGSTSANKKSAGRKRRRTKITEQIRAEVKKLVSEKKTGAEIAKSLGISLPSVQNIKKAFGLVKKRKS